MIDHVTAVDPGTMVTFGRSPSVTRWHQVPWLKAPFSESTLRSALVSAVHKRMTTVRSIGACLSGGLDSSLVAAIAARVLAAQGSCLDTYSIGMEGSPDVAAARIVATHIGSRHHERIVTASECLDAIPHVIRAIESYDITTVRASVGNYLLAKFIREVTPDVKVVLNGDGADEALGGYLYMRAAPDDVAWENETDRLLQEIHRYDVLRSERSMAAFGLESRSPFLDRQFVAVARAIPTALLRSSGTTMEKTVLRSAFQGFLPDEILWRRKEAFSDGISRTDNSWFKMTQAKGELEAGHLSRSDYTINPPPTPEAAWYRAIFHRWYPAAAASVIPAMWMPRFITATDPSARTLIA
jgi:asparagine synthase (glutamine-hydrolysing)